MAYKLPRHVKMNREERKIRNEERRKIEANHGVWTPAAKSEYRLWTKRRRRGIRREKERCRRNPSLHAPPAGGEGE